MRFFILVVVDLVLAWQAQVQAQSSCRPVPSSVCQDVGYTTTLHPSGAPGFTLQQITDLLGTNCSPEIQTLVCRVAVPECTAAGGEDRTKPCRSLCEKVKTDCETVLRLRRISWPTKLSCDLLPESNCVQGKAAAGPGAPSSLCVSMEEVPLCKGLSYTHTLLPNRMGHTTVVQVSQELHQFYPLVKVDCSVHLKPFICSMFLPECEGGRSRPPCRTLCELARGGCERLMTKFGFPWPSSLNCDELTTESCPQLTPDPDLFYQIPSPTRRCENIEEVPLCKDLSYSQTVLPNALGHRTQAEASLALHQFYPLVKLQCSAHLKPFLCSVYTPECVGEGKARAPCKTLCEQARSGCSTLINAINFQWPQALSCEAFSTDTCDHYGVSTTGGICEPVTVPMCQGLSYNMTITPNLLGHLSQREAAEKMSFFNSLVQTMCPTDSNIFLCRVYAPQCMLGEVQRPCRSFCERVKTGCETMMNTFGVSWPAELQCNTFPQEQCIDDGGRSQMLTAEQVQARLDAAGFSVSGKSLSLRTARLLLNFMDADESGDLDAVEMFKLEHFMAVIRREYVEKYDRPTPDFTHQSLLRKSLNDHDLSLDDRTFRTLWQQHGTRSGINYDEYTAAITKLLTLRERFHSNLLSVPCDCRIASFSFKQFMKSAIV